MGKNIITEKKLKRELTEEQYERFVKNWKEDGIDIALLNLPDLGYDTVMVSTCVNSLVKQLRIENGLTQNDLANVLNVSRKEYWRFEQEGYSISFLELTKIAMFYNVSLDWFTGFFPTKKPFMDGENCVNGFTLSELKASKKK